MRQRERFRLNAASHIRVDRAFRSCPGCNGGQGGLRTSIYATGMRHASG